MDRFEVSHFSDNAMLHNTKLVAGQDCTTTAVLLTRLAEIEARKLHLRLGYPSMVAYCVHELHLYEDAAFERIRAARTARRFAAILMALADGRLHLRAVLMLAPHLTTGNADELVAAATHKTRVELEHLLARRFPRPDLPERLQAIPAPSPIMASPVAHEGQLSTGGVDASSHSAGQTVTDLSERLGTSRVEPTIPDWAASGNGAASLPLPVS